MSEMPRCMTQDDQDGLHREAGQGASRQPKGIRTTEDDLEDEANRESRKGSSSDDQEEVRENAVEGGLEGGGKSKDWVCTSVASSLGFHLFLSRFSIPSRPPRAWPGPARICLRRICKQSRAWRGGLALGGRARQQIQGSDKPGRKGRRGCDFVA